MASDSTTTISASGKPWKGRRAARGRDEPALVVAWSIDEPERVGQVAVLPVRDGARLLGRGSPRDDDALPRLRFYRQRPGLLEPTDALRGRGISRDQLHLTPGEGPTLDVERVGRCALLVNGAPADRATVRPGDTILLQNQLLLLVTARPEQLPALRGDVFTSLHPFGRPDAHGLVGETPEMWAFRERAAFVAGSDAHVLITGPSGVGKELAARAVHGWSARAPRPLVARNAATFPESLIDAELFGNVADYPNPGMPERAGLVGDADRSTLFLDEIGELPTSLQAHLLRVLDAGEYQRLGASRVRRADLRFVGATNRPVAELKHDLAARLTLRLEVPGLDERRADLPLLVRHLLQRAAGRSPEVADRYFEPGGDPRVGPELLERLLRHQWTTHVRELDRLLWQAMAESQETWVALTPGVEAELTLPEPEPLDDLGADDIRAALDRHEGNVTRAARELGLKNRYALYRLMKRHGLGD